MSTTTSMPVPGTGSALFEQSLTEKGRLAEFESRREEALVARKIGGVLDPRLSALAREIAQDIHGIDEILKRHGFTGQEDQHWQDLTRNYEFNRLLAEQIREWASADSTASRIMLKSQAAVENGIPAMYAMLEDPNESGANRAKAFELLGKLGKVMSDPAANGTGPGSINRGLNIKITMTARNGEKTSAVIDQNGAPVEATPNTAIDVEVTTSHVNESSFLLGTPVLDCGVEDY